MAIEKTWTMNCVIAGAEVLLSLQNASELAARRQLENLTSELDSKEVDYLLFRLQCLLNEDVGVEASNKQ